MITIAKYWRQWVDPRLIIIVLKNKDLNMVTWEQRITEGNPKFQGSQDVPDIPYAEYGRMLGLEGISVETPEQMPDALDRAFAARKPIILEVASDPNVPLLPPHINVEQARALMSSIAGGDADTWGMIKQIYKDVTAEYFPEK